MKRSELVWVTYLLEELPTNWCRAWEDIGVLLPVGVCWYSGLTDHAGASAGGSRADGVDLSWFCRFKPSTLSNWFCLSNLISLFKPEKFMIKMHNVCWKGKHPKEWFGNSATVCELIWAYFGMQFYSCSTTCQKVCTLCFRWCWHLWCLSLVPCLLNTHYYCGIMNLFLCSIFHAQLVTLWQWNYV